jgi:SAM-dependent methyltransferase
MGATQFRLLCSIGLRSHHRLLDFGCGSLRAGRFLIAYLDPDHYWGVEPNRWLLEDALRHQIGDDMVRIKRPSFDHNDRFEAQHLATTFDFIVAQSIFSHCSIPLIRRSLEQFAAVLEPEGLIVATFVEGPADHTGDDWVYPDVVEYRRRTIRAAISAADLVGQRIPWYHPRQSWYVLARDPSRLPNRAMRRQLRGAVLFDADFEESWKVSARRRLLWRRLRHRLGSPPSRRPLSGG